MLVYLSGPDGSRPPPSFHSSLHSLPPTTESSSTYLPGPPLFDSPYPTELTSSTPDPLPLDTWKVLPAYTRQDSPLTSIPPLPFGVRRGRPGTGTRDGVVPSGQRPRVDYEGRRVTGDWTTLKGGREGRVGRDGRIQKGWRGDVFVESVQTVGVRRDGRRSFNWGSYPKSEVGVGAN